MRRSTGLALVAIGAILVFAVHVQLPILNLKLTGLVLVITGSTGLKVPQRAYGWLSSHQGQVRAALDRFMAVAEEPARVPLDTLARVPVDTLLQPEASATTSAGQRGLPGR
ncbi:MAG: hypothetical protein J2P30_06175 [Actinobacteria bacterium]|nr:hypothetical protein [Actinomycetota bacterium]